MSDSEASINTQDVPKRRFRTPPKPPRFGLAAGTLGKGCTTIERDVRNFGRAIEASLVKRGVSIDVGTWALVNSVCRHERIARLLQKEIARNSTLTNAERLELFVKLGEATDRRDKILVKLGIIEIKPTGATPTDVWDSLGKSSE